MTITLRAEDQVPFKAAIYDSWQKGNRNVLGVANTGFGKSVVMSDIALDHVRAGQHVAIMAHRNELVTQMSSHIARRGIPHRIIGSNKTVAQAIKKHRKEFGRSFIDPSAATGVIGVDTMIARESSIRTWAQQISLFLGDEHHHCIGNWYRDDKGNIRYKSDGSIDWKVDPNKWGKACSMFTNARGAGFTATPQRADGQGLGRIADGIYDDMVIGPSMRWLIDRGFLSDYEIVCPTDDLGSIENETTSKDGDWSHQKMRKAVEDSGKKIVGNVVETYMAYAYMRKAIVFATDIETAQEMANEFNACGIPAAAVHGKSSDTWRESSLERFADGSLRVLINVDLFDEGFDCPDAEVCIMARPTASLGKYMQMVGRVLRYVAGKVALIIDHVSNVIRHGMPDKYRQWTLDRRDKRAKQTKDPDDIPLTVCNNCQPRRYYEAFRTCCPHCGAAKPLPEPRSRSIEMVSGDLVLLDRATLAKMRAATVLESAGDIAARVASAAGPIAGKAAANRQIEKIAAHNELQESIAVWAGHERATGYSDSEIMRRFYLTMGADMLSVLDASQTRKELEGLSAVVKGWVR